MNIADVLKGLNIDQDIKENILNIAKKVKSKLDDFQNAETNWTSIKTEQPDTVIKGLRYTVTEIESLIDITCLIETPITNHINYITELCID